MNKKIIWTIIVVIVIGVIIWVLNSKSDTQTGTNGPIRIGANFSLTSFGASWGEYDRDAALLAVKQINNSGGINGQQVQLIIEDNGSSAQGAVNAANKLINVDKVQFMLLGWADQTNAVAPLLDPNKVIGITISAGSSDITKQSEWLFRTWPKDIFLTQALAKHVQNKGYKKVAVFRTIGGWEDSVSPGFISQVQSIGASVVVEEKITSNTTDVRTSVTKILAAKPDVIYIVALEPNTASFIKTLRAQGNQTPILFATELNSPSILNGVSGVEDLEGIVYPIYKPASDKFVDDFSTEYGRVPGVSADTTYDAVNIIAQVIKETNTPDQERIRTALSQVKGYQGASGEISFDENRDRQVAPVVLRTVKGGKFVAIE